MNSVDKRTIAFFCTIDVICLLASGVTVATEAPLVLRVVVCVCAAVVIALSVYIIKDVVWISQLTRKRKEEE